ncbi:hypothetical protein [Falsiroseomonas sp. E2-1-a20]|uniref:hypothetical protein n=1 Tax=Falsiroseomonas sp. E2-1-a20 TaxID=3239300 RepID=UPI003F2E1FC6
MDQENDNRIAAAKWLIEALESGSPLAPLPDGLAPPDVEAGAEIAAAVLEETGYVPCGFRLLFRDAGDPVAGPMLEGRLLRAGTTVALPALRHARASAAMLGVLAEALLPDDEGAPVLARVHPALDLAASRFTDLPEDVPTLTADLGLLGYVVVGKAAASPAGPIAVSLAEASLRRKGLPVDLMAAFATAAVAARARGGLPAGAVLVVAGLSPALVPVAGASLAARFAGLGKAEAAFV